MAENKRAGREDELRKKLKAACDRYESVFGKPLGVAELKDFLDFSEAQNKRVFLTDRIGVLSDQDVAYLRNVLKENVSTSPAQPVQVATAEDVDSIEEIDEDGDDSFA